MKNKLILIIFVSQIILAQTARKYSNEFLNIGVDAASFGMAKAVVATSNDVNSSYWNPAGLAQIEDYQGSLMHAEYFEGIAKYDYAGFAMPLDDRSAIGISIIRFGVDDILNTTKLIDANGNINYNNISLFSAADYAVNLSYARHLPVQGLNVGLNTKIIRRIIGDFATSWGFGLDVAVQLERNNWKLGLMLRDITTTFNTWSIDDDGFQKIKDANKFVDEKGVKLFISEVNGGKILTYQDNTPYLDENGKTISPNQKLPQTTEITKPKAQLGIAKKIEITRDVGLLTELDLNLRFTKTNDIISSKIVSIDPAFGFQLDYIETVFLRGGVGNLQNELQFDNTKKLSLQPNFGVGFKYRGIQIDYALTNIGNVGSALYSNIFSIKVDFDYFR